MEFLFLPVNQRKRQHIMGFLSDFLNLLCFLHMLQHSAMVLIWLRKVSWILMTYTSEFNCPLVGWRINFTKFSISSRVLMAVIFGAFAVGQTSSFAPDYAQAKISTNRLFKLLDRVPEIDSYNVEGQQPVSLGFL